MGDFLFLRFVTKAVRNNASDESVPGSIPVSCNDFYVCLVVVVVVVVDVSLLFCPKHIICHNILKCFLQC